MLNVHEAPAGLRAVISSASPYPRRWASFETSQGRISPRVQREETAGVWQEQYSVYSSIECRHEDTRYEPLR
jgi:hypothetical protein